MKSDRSAGTNTTEAAAPGKTETGAEKAAAEKATTPAEAKPAPASDREKPAAKALPPGEVRIPGATGLTLDGRDADWRNVPLLIDGKEAARPPRKGAVLAIASLKAARTRDDLWMLITAAEDIAAFAARNSACDVCNVYFDTDTDEATGNTVYHEKLTQGNERSFYISLNPLPEYARKGRLKDVRCFALMSVSRYNPSLTARWKKKEAELKKRGKKFYFGNEFDTPAFRSESHEKDARIALGKRTFEVRVPWRALSDTRLNRVRITLIEHVDVEGARLGSAIVHCR